ncbi:MAG: ABC transporter ATP-binding protein [Desulfosoma sp.]|uniref:ABC transporter ATP-binding protein n=1 Tax=Desulfosoma sp. TaxID=2603217 RepID=UPI00404B8BF9
MGQMTLEVRNLCFRHKNAKEDVLKNVSFCADVGRVTVILGPNGSGKSTLFKCSIGLWSASRGDVLTGGVDARKFSIQERAKIFSLVPQEHEPPFPYRVFDVVLMGRAPRIGFLSSPQKRDYDKAREAINSVGIGPLADRPYTKISGGERQLTLIARALAQEAPILVMDEPTSHLDFRNQIDVLSKIRAIARHKNLTILVTLHDPNMAALFADHAVVLKEGSVICSGSPRRIIDEELIREVYGVEAKTISVNGHRVLCPVIKEDSL